MPTIDDQQRLQTLLANTASAIFEINLKGAIISMNAMSLLIFNAQQQDEVLNKPLLDCLPTTDKDRVAEFLQRSFQGETVKFEFVVNLPFGQTTQSMQLIPIRTPQNANHCIMAICHDITDLKKTEQMLFTAQKKYRSVIDNIPDLLFEIDTDGRLLFLNRVLPGYSLDKVVGTLVTDYILEEDQKNIFRETLEKVKQTGKSHEYELVTNLNDGRTTYWNSRITPMFENGEIKRLILLTQDITEKKRILSQLQQSQKLESLGKLAGGVAHEFNNLLAIILLHCTLMRPPLKNNKDANEALDIIVRSSERAEELTAQLLGFARKGKYGAKPIDINPIVKEAASLIQTSVMHKPKIKLQFDLATDLPKINASESQVLQCVMNLGLNAVDAMPEGGTITFKSYQMLQDTLLEQQNVNSVCIEVLDSGMGIIPENLSRIFDPFFTTKDIGKGTGLGLSMIYGIMENHYGRIDVTSKPDEGTKFTLIFPALAGDSSNEKTKNSRRR